MMRINRTDAHRINLLYQTQNSYNARYTSALKWLGLLLSGYLFNRVICVYGNLPEDYLEMSFLGHVVTLANLLLMGFMQGWFCEVIEDTARNTALFKSHLFIFIYFATFPIFAVIGNWSFLAHSVTTETQVPLDFAIFLFVLSLVVLLVVTWHLWYARTVFLRSADFKAYCAGRAVAFCFFLGSLLLAEADGKPIVIHLHHYFLAWVISLFAVFNHPISIVTLGITAAVFVQGLSTYSAAAIIFRPTDRRPLTKFSSFIC